MERRIQGFGRKPGGKRSLAITRRIWEGNNEMDFKYVGCGGVEWIELAQDRDRWQAFVNVAMNLRLKRYAEKVLTNCKQVSFSRWTVLDVGK